MSNILKITDQASTQLKKIIDLKYYFATLIFVTILIYLNLYVEYSKQQFNINYIKKWCNIINKLTFNKIFL